MLNKVLSLAGWPALAIIVVAIVVAQIMSAHKLIRCGLWFAAAAVAVIGAINECRK